MMLNDDSAGVPLGSTNYQRISDHLRADILNNRFAMGARLKVAELAARYNVSQMPVREALQQLSGEGLVRLIPNRGAVVRAVDEKFITNIYDIRVVLEGFFTRRAATVATAQDIAELSAIEQAYERYSKPEEIGQRLDLNFQFHSRIFKLAGNEEALPMVKQHEAMGRALVRHYNHTPARIWQICQQHRAIIDALASHDAERAEEAASRHMIDARDDLVEQLRRNPIVKDRPKAPAATS
jgi:DNA-binding GntR family transcriptional regulator